MEAMFALEARWRVRRIFFFTWAHLSTAIVVREGMKGKEWSKVFSASLLKLIKKANGSLFAGRPANV
jgi:hypothetical protein